MVNQSFPKSTAGVARARVVLTVAMQVHSALTQWVTVR